MVEESVQTVLKQRQVAPAPPPPPKEDDVEAECIQEIEPQPQPGLLWRVGSGLWGASSVSFVNVS